MKNKRPKIIIHHRSKRFELVVRSIAMEDFLLIQDPCS